MINTTECKTHCFKCLHILHVLLSAAPENPSSVVVDDIDESSVTLKWNKPKNDGGKKLLGYVIEYKEISSGRWKTYNEMPIKETMHTGQSGNLRNSMFY